MVTPENFTLYYLGRSGRKYAVDGYAPDAAASACTLNPAGAAASTSPTYWRVPEDGVVYDLSIHTGQTVSVGGQFYADGALVNGGVLRWANQLDTLGTVGRAQLTIPFTKGALLSIIEV